MPAPAHRPAVRSIDARVRAGRLRRLADAVEASAVMRLDLDGLRSIDASGAGALAARLVDRHRRQLLLAADELRDAAWQLDPEPAATDRPDQRWWRLRRSIRDAADGMVDLARDDVGTRHLRVVLAATRFTLEEHCLPALDDRPRDPAARRP